ncbi:MAG TPA: phosphatase PAP2 family protein [Candidatus Kapabacteria bacterium]|nr:phosphatase PAP2 family protein [Candidatus Kapabacteria bacterium]
MPIITKQQNWYIIYLGLILFLIIKYKQKGLIIVLVLLVAVGISDFISSQVIKEAVGRLRPCRSLSNIHLLVPCGAGKSFPSSHAVNNFSLATVLAYNFKKYNWVFYGIAGLIAFSRISVGAHYPFDVIGGAVIGAIIGYLIALLFFKYIFKKV